MSFAKRDVAVPPGPDSPQLVVVPNVYQHQHRHSIITPSIKGFINDFEKGLQSDYSRDETGTE
jgi:hypothetical protein